MNTADPREEASRSGGASSSRGGASGGGTTTLPDRESYYDGMPPLQMPTGPRYGASLGLIVKYLLLGLLNAVVIASLPTMFDKPDYGLAISAIVALVVIDVVYISKRRFIPAKYLLPGTLFLLVFAVYPIFYLVYISTTNYGTGNNLNKETAIERIEANSISAGAESIRYDLQILAEGNPGGELVFLLTNPDGERFIGTADGLTPIDDADIIDDGRRETIDGFVALNTGQANDRVGEVNALIVPGPSGEIANDGFGAAFAKTQTRVYDPETDTIFDSSTNTTYTVENGQFVSENGDALVPGWRAGVGFDNYDRLINDNDTRNVFFRVLVWTILFSLFSVILSFGLGLLLALVFNDERMFGRKLVSQPDHHPVRDPELHDRARVARHAQSTVRGDQPMARPQPAVARRTVAPLLLDPARQHLARVPVHVPRVYRGAAEHPVRPHRGRGGRRRRRVQGVPADHPAAAARGGRTVARGELRVQLQQLQHHLPAHRRPSPSAGQ